MKTKKVLSLATAAALTLRVSQRLATHTIGLRRTSSLRWW